MVTLEQVEKLRTYANVTYDEAKTALENAGGDILQALIDLERQGKVAPPEGGGQFTSAPLQAQPSDQSKEQNENNHDQSGRGKESSAFRTSMSKFFKWCGEMIHRGNVNSLIVEKNSEQLMKLPVTVLVVLLLCAFWAIVPLMIIGLFFHFRYSFRGPDLGSDKVNHVMDSVAKAAEDIKNEIKN